MINGIDMNGFVSMIRDLKAVQKAGNSPMQEAALESARKSKSTAASGDMVLLSPSAKQLSDFFVAQEAMDAENGGDVDLEGMKLRSEMLAEALQMQLAAFQNKMVGILSSTGMNADMPFNLQNDPLGATSVTTGAIRVTNGHPDAAGIENLMKNMPGLSKEFNEIAGLASVVRANNLTGRGGEPGGLNPLSVMAQYAKNTSAVTGEKFNLRMGTNDLSCFFN